MPALDTSKAAFGKPGGRVIQSARCSSTPRRQDETCVMDVGLMLGPPTEWDVDGTGIVIDAHGEVVYIAPGGMAARWKEIKAGDMLLSISGATYVPGTPLSAYLEPETKRAYLVTVRRLLKADRFPLMSLVARTALDSSRTPRFASEREAAQALENAGCYHQGLKGAYKLTHTELEKAAHSILEKPELMAKYRSPRPRMAPEKKLSGELSPRTVSEDASSDDLERLEQLLDVEADSISAAERHLETMSA